MNRFIVPVLFSGIALLAVCAFMAFQQFGGVVRIAGPDAETAGNQKTAGAKASGFAMALTSMFETATGQEVIKSNVALDPFMPAAPEGWDVAP